MKRLTLKLDEIRVKGFEVLPADVPAGTVQGAELGMITAYTNCQQDTCWNGSCGTGFPCRQCP